MSVSFLTPVDAVVAAAGVGPIAALVLSHRRARCVRAGLALGEPRRSALVVPLACIAAVAALVGAAAAQPVVHGRETARVRTDAQAWVVLDTSRSMLARRGPTEVDRLHRAKAFALELRSALGDVPVGLASLTDRLLPTLFPSPDAGVFAAELRETIAVESPPPIEPDQRRSTTYQPLGGMRSAGFFAPAKPHRLLVVLTDGETRPFGYTSLGRRLRGSPAIHTFLVRFWRDDEHVYSRGRPELAYRPDPASGAELDHLAAAAGGQVFDESQLGRVERAARIALGRGRELEVGRAHGQTALAPYAALAAVVPLSLLLWRRNLS